MNEITILGAGGFIGTSLTEALVLAGDFNVNAVVRKPRNLAALCRFGSRIRTTLADAEDSDSLTRALAGASVAVNLTTGPPAAIVRSTRAIFDACKNRRVPLLIHLSSAVVYGSVAATSLSDDASPLNRHWMPYARAKAAAEVFLRQRLSEAPPTVLILRPGIVWGVRSPHTLDIALRLFLKRAFLVDGGAGIFNGIYIGNLLASIRACWEHPRPPAGFFNVGDSELTTWRDFFTAFAEPLGAEVSRLPTVSGTRLPWSIQTVLEYVQSLSWVNACYHKLKVHLPQHLKTALKEVITASPGYFRPAPSYTLSPPIDAEMWHLQKVRHKLPIAKFARQFNFAPPHSFNDGVNRTLWWLSSLGLAQSHDSTPEFL